MREHFIVDIRLHLALEERNSPASLSIADHVRIPIGSFHQSNRDGRPTSVNPGQESLDISFRFPMIGLQRETRIRIGPVWWICEKPGKDLYQQSFRIGLFHIEDHRRGKAHRQIEDRSKPRRNRLVASFRINRVEVWREGGDFDGELDSRYRSEMVPLQ